jgi:DNA-directed RNA polymerase subunit beta'
LHPYLFDTIVSITGMTADQLDQVLHHRARLDGGIAESLAETGAAAVRGELRAVDLTTLARGRGRPAELAQAMLASATKPEQLILDALPITPADLRPLVPLVGGRFATSDLNDLYRRVINRNTRLKRLLELGAPPQILINEQMQLQLDVEHLIQNGLQGRTLTSPECRALRSLHESVTSRFSQALKGKRVDYSGRGSVVPHRGLDRTSVLLSRTIARELFRPFVYELLERQGHVRILKVAKAMVNSHDARAELALDEVSRNHPVIIFPRPNEGARVAGLLIQLWDEPAIGLHPERIEELGVVPGQAVVVHLPIDPLARAEARELQRVMPRKPETSPLGWIGRAVQSQNIGTTLINAALHRELDPVADRLSRRLLGRHESNPRLPELPPDWTP